MEILEGDYSAVREVTIGLVVHWACVVIVAFESDHMHELNWRP